MKIFVIVSLVFVAQASVFAQAKNNQSGQKARLSEDEKSALRLEFLNRGIQHFRIRQTSTPPVIATPPKTPAVRWTNPTSGTRDGILSIFHSGGRPVCVAQLSINSGGMAIHEFHVTSDAPFELLRDGKLMWKSDQPTLNFQPVKDSPAPRDTELQRMVQMRRIAAEFDVWDDHGWKETVRQKLRLLPQPVYRYTDEAKSVIDGAIFSFALANDPEAVLILEAIKKENKTHWQFTFSPSTIYALQAERGGEMVWEAPERRVFGRGYMNQFVSPYRMGPDDPKLKPLLPEVSQSK